MSFNKKKSYKNVILNCLNNLSFTSSVFYSLVTLYSNGNQLDRHIIFFIFIFEGLKYGFIICYVIKVLNLN